MLFDRKEFEHKIEESKLKKGLRLFLKQKVVFTHKTDNFELSFLIHEKTSHEISIHLKGDKIINYTCNCGSENYCEHLAAVIFYLEQDTLAAVKLPILPSRALKLQNKKSKKTIFAKYVNQLKFIADPVLELTKLNKNQLNDINKKINFEKNGAATFNNDFYFNLAITAELPKLFYTNTDPSIELLITNAKKELEIKFTKGLTVEETQAFIDAAYYSLRSQLNFRSGAYPFLISRACILIKEKDDFEILKSLLKKRNQNKNSLDPVNRKIVAEIQLSVMEALIIGKTYSLKNYENTIELPIALAELEFLKNKKANGFKLLGKYAEQIKKFNTNKYLDLIDEALKFAKQYGNKNAELFYLEEKFVCGYLINENDLMRFFSLNTNEDDVIKAKELIKKLKKESTFYTFEKVAVILLQQNRLDELILEIKREKNKFKLLNEIGIKKLPEHSSDFFSLYIKHFVNAIADAKFPYFQQQLFDLAKIFLDRLSGDIRNGILEKIKEKMIYEKHMVQYISECYPEAISKSR